MKKLVQEKELALKLRRQGLSYNEILKQVPVAKSSLSLWLKGAPLTEREKKVLKKRTDGNISKGRIRAAAELRQRRLEREDVWTQEAQTLFLRFKDQPFFHAGIILYWAEGAKTDTRWMIINTDVDVIVTMRNWVIKYLNIDIYAIQYRLFIHKPYADGSCESWWQSKLEAKTKQFLKTVYKETAYLYKLKPGHHGCLRMELKNSKQYLHKMKVLQHLAVEYYMKR